MSCFSVSRVSLVLSTLPALACRSARPVLWHGCSASSSLISRRHTLCTTLVGTPISCKFVANPPNPPQPAQPAAKRVPPIPIRDLAFGQLHPDVAFRLLKKSSSKTTSAKPVEGVHVRCIYPSEGAGRFSETESTDRVAAAENRSAPCEENAVQFPRRKRFLQCKFQVSLTRGSSSFLDEGKAGNSAQCRPEESGRGPLHP